MVLGVRQVYSSDLPKTWERIKHTDHVLQLWRWTNYMYMKIMMINKNLKRPMLHKLLTERGQICALVSGEGPSMGFRCGFCVSCSTDVERPGYLPAVLTIQFLSPCNNLFIVNILFGNKNSTHPSGAFPVHKYSVLSRKIFAIFLERSNILKAYHFVNNNLFSWINLSCCYIVQNDI